MNLDLDLMISNIYIYIYIVYDLIWVRYLVGVMVVILRDVVTEMDPYAWPNSEIWIPALIMRSGHDGWKSNEEQGSHRWPGES